MLLGSTKGTSSNWAAVTSTIEMAQARKRGMKLVVVDPRCSNAAAIADEWVPIRPGTDGALVLAMMNVLINELGLYDREFLRRLSNGPYLVRDRDGRYMRDAATNKPLLWDENDQRPKPYDAADLRTPAMEGSFQVNGEPCQPASALLSECIHPECVGMDHAGGNWAKSLPPRRGGDTGVHFGALLDYGMKNLDVMDGAMENSPKLRVSRVG
jgi:anaerobic selenocysteine-containing dehydrogenase